MKIPKVILTMIATVAIISAGCSKQGSPRSDTQATANPVDIFKFQDTFNTGSFNLKNDVNATVITIKEMDYSNAVVKLQAIQANYTLTAEQQTAVKDAIANLQKAMADQPKN